MFETFKKFLVEELNINADAISVDAKLSDDLGINSLELADLVYKCEETFGVVFDDDDLRNLVTVGDVINYIEKSKN
ncbi:MAG: acyl carrier protein [Clostridia bacterium]|nr:acyl carrier protein [Clostridia bacterium]